MKTKEKYMSVLKKQYETSKQEIALTAIFQSVYTEKISRETIHTKIANQLNSMHTSINRINPKFNEKSKNYDKVEQQLFDTLNQYEANLVHFCKNRDAEINDYILKKVKSETEILIAMIEKEYRQFQKKNEKNTVLHSINAVVDKIKPKKKGQANSTNEKLDDQEKIKKLKKQVKILNTKINDLNEQKIAQVFEAMESGDKQISTQIRKPRTINKIAKFFINRFNTYSAILKNVIEPVKQRIDAFQVKEINETTSATEEFNLQEIEEKIKQKQAEVLAQINIPI